MESSSKCVAENCEFPKHKNAKIGGGTHCCGFCRGNAGHGKYCTQFARNSARINKSSLIQTIRDRKISFIHIGKAGGSSVCDVFGRIKNYHLRKNYHDAEKYIIWIRNPLNRFVSSFNHSLCIVNADVSSIPKIDLNHCIAPAAVRRLQRAGFAFSRDYDALVKKFQSANELAESLYSKNQTMRANARNLMNRQEEHLYKGIGWYLNNGDLVKKSRDRILFVGRVEYMKEDIQALAKKLDVELFYNGKKARENVYVGIEKKYLSPLAIQNIIAWCKDTDYAAIEQLFKYNWIDETTYKSYFEYVQ